MKKQSQPMELQDVHVDALLTNIIEAQMMELQEKWDIRIRKTDHFIIGIQVGHRKIFLFWPFFLVTIGKLNYPKSHHYSLRRLLSRKRYIADTLYPIKPIKRVSDLIRMKK